MEIVFGIRTHARWMFGKKKIKIKRRKKAKKMTPKSDRWRHHILAVFICEMQKAMHGELYSF